MEHETHSETPQPALNVIVVNVPASVEDIERQENEQRWYCQKFSDKMQEFETQVATIVNNNRFWLSLTYSLLFLVSLARIILYLYMVKVYSESFIASDRTMLIIESCLSMIWLGYFINQYISKLRLAYVENVRWTSLMYVLFCVQYFSVSYWAVEILFYSTPTMYAVIALVFFIVYGFMAEKSPNSLAVTVYVILMLFLVEAVIRIMICRCYNPWKMPGAQEYTRKEIPILPYIDSKYAQKSCGICLKDFAEDEKICPLSCHTTHIFHSECLKEWLDRNHFCPFCRAAITANN